MTLNDTRKKISGGLDLSINPEKPMIINRTKFVINMGLLQTQLTPLIDGQGYNKDIVTTTFGQLIKNLLTEISFYNIGEEALEKAMNGIEKETESLPVKGASTLLRNNFYILESYLSGKMDPVQVMIWLRGIMLFLEIDFLTCLKTINNDNKSEQHND